MKTKNKTPAEVENVTITMSRKTAEAVKQACEEYLRLRMGQFEDFTNEVCCWDYVEQMEKECHTTDDGEKELCEYTFKHCPECGAKIIIHKSCEFCRWHLRDTTCFNDLEKRPRTTPEDSCWNWEERE